jgi:hypothetical protein
LVPGRRDGLGERWFTTAADDSAVEVLRLHSEVTVTPGFEQALRDRVEQLSSFKDLGFATIRELYQDGADLMLVSTRVSGQPLSELTDRIAPAKRAAFVARLLRKAAAALAALEAVGPGVTHGALTADRIVLTANGGVCLTEYAFGSALPQLSLWPEELFLQFGLLAPPDEHGQAAFEPRTSVMQLAAIASSMLLDRPVTLDVFDHELPGLVAEIAAAGSATSSLLIRPLATWLGYAFHLRGVGYATAAEAEAGLKQLLAFEGPAAAAELDAATFPPVTASPVAEHVQPVEHPAPARPTRATAPADIRLVTTNVQPVPAPIPDAAPVFREIPRRQLQPYVAWIAVGFAVLSIGEAAFITRLLIRGVPSAIEPAVLVESSPGTTVMVDGRSAGSTPLQLHITAETRAIRLVPAAAAVSSGESAPPAGSSRRADSNGIVAAKQPAGQQRSGAVAFSAPFDLMVFEGDRVLGSTADGPIVASAGTHTLDLVNAALGYRVQQAVNIRTGSIERVTITPPMGRISVNAEPWAQVLIDDTAVGDTPIANIPATLGEHQVTFRHPQLGERHERVIVHADVPARVSTTFQRP